MERPKLLIIIGFFLVLFGFVAPFLIILGVLESTFFLNFVSYAASVGGLFMGIIGAAWYSRLYRGQDNQ
jgi:membrane associated rhomboid family serine protease